MAKVEAHRRSNAQGCKSEACEAGCCEGDDPVHDKARKGLLRGVSPSICQWWRIKNLFRRRCSDLIGVSGYWGFIVTGYTVATQYLLEPSESKYVQVMYPAFMVTLVLFKLCWVGILYHGPGRPSKSPAENDEALVQELPPVVEQALQAGRMCRSNPFGAEDTLCEPCGRSKPVFASHCKSCNECSYWMDHHCSLCGQCIGFRNLRCFLVWLFYGHVLLAILYVSSLRHLYLVGWVSDVWVIGRRLAWLFYLWSITALLFNNFQTTSLRITAGWPSLVMYKKFKNLEVEGRKLERRLLDKLGSEDEGDGSLREAWKRLKEAIEAVNLKMMAVLYGMFLTPVPAVTLGSVFGEPPSLLWLLPLRPGGQGQPWKCPEHVSGTACEAWKELGNAMELGEQVLASFHPRTKPKAAGFQQTMTPP